MHICTMNTKESELVGEWNQVAQISVNELLSGKRRGGTLFPRAERIKLMSSSMWDREREMDPRDTDRPLADDLKSRYY